MERNEAIERLKQLEGVALDDLQNQYQITRYVENGKQNKGWAGHIIERFLGLPLNSSRAPNFGSWELKVVPLKYNRQSQLVPKETMAITMLDPYEVTHKDFYESHLYLKLKKMLVVARLDVQNTQSTLLRIVDFDIDSSIMLDKIIMDYNLIQKIIREEGFTALSGRIGTYIQPRTKGKGHGSISRAFYARKNFLSQVLGL